jgi:hypothetical protein
MSELVKICRFKGNDTKFDNDKTYIVKITEKEKVTYEKELLSVNMFGKKTFITKQLKKYSIVAITQNKIMTYSKMDKFLENWEIIG